MQPLPARQAEGQLHGMHPLPSREAEKHVREVHPLPPREAEKQLRGVHPLPSRETETKLRSVQSGTRGSAELEAGQARAEEFARDQARAVHHPRLLRV
tara:strand:- start:6263 stop:6556 length:294 start_codon:yes stop_codon:yes gene_type:complete